jgi:hypothetical protein
MKPSVVTPVVAGANMARKSSYISLAAPSAISSQAGLMMSKEARFSALSDLGVLGGKRWSSDPANAPV